MYQYILFDFDGTVFATEEGITRSVRYAINKVGLDAPLHELRCFVGPPLKDMFMERFGFDPEAAEQAVSDFRERYIPIGLYECSIFPGIRDLISDLKAAGFITGIATSKPQALAEKLLDSEGMLPLFDVISGSHGAGNDTKAQVLRVAMDALGADPERTVLIGDTKYDVNGAGECGIDCIGVRYGYAAEGELEAAGPEYIADSVDDLRALLLGK